MHTNQDAAPTTTAPVETTFRSWLCVLCGFVYNELDGRPDDGIAPGTRWNDVPEDWSCPECGGGKSDFEMVEV
jgi:rubredoxin